MPDPFEIEIEVLQPEVVNLEIQQGGQTQSITASPDSNITVQVGGATVNFGSFINAPTAKRSEMVDESLSYFGDAVVGAQDDAAVWRISKVEYVSGVMTTKYADSGNFSQIWDDRASLIYE